MLRLLEITDQVCSLSLSGVCLVVTTTERKLLQRIPLEELDVLLLSHPGVSLSGALLAELGRFRVIVLLCDRKCLPLSYVMPVNTTSTYHLELLEAQLKMTQPCRKRLWKSIVQSKIKGQDAILQKHRNSSALKNFFLRVRSGDEGNCESQAAAIYWKKLAIFHKRDREAEDANRFLNYVYALLYATTARYLAAYSLHPQMALSHCNPHNAFCLASDLMEPFRPLVDECVLNLLQSHNENEPLTPELKRFLLEKFVSKSVIMTNGASLQLPDAIRLMSLSYRECVIDNSSASLLLPCYD